MCNGGVLYRGLSRIPEGHLNIFDKLASKYISKERRRQSLVFASWYSRVEIGRGGVLEPERTGVAILR